jgi:hypothetical protein
LFFLFFFSPIFCCCLFLFFVFFCLCLFICMNFTFFWTNLEFFFLIFWLSYFILFLGREVIMFFSIFCWFYFIVVVVGSFSFKNVSLLYDGCLSICYGGFIIKFIYYRILNKLFCVIFSLYYIFFS